MPCPQFHTGQRRLLPGATLIWFPCELVRLLVSEGVFGTAYIHVWMPLSVLRQYRFCGSGLCRNQSERKDQIWEGRKKWTTSLSASGPTEQVLRV
jgi:hypothetical protein